MYSRGNTLLIGAIVLALVAGGLYWWSVSGRAEESDAMMETGDEMMEGEDAMMGEKDAMMEDDQTAKDEGAMMEDDSMKKDDAMMEKGSYEAYAPEKLAKAESGKVVLFFRASWCPTCRALDADIRSHLGAIPSGVTILDVDYDNSTALKQKYGVTYQHTLVQVDAKGNSITKWQGSPTLAALLTEVK